MLKEGSAAPDFLVRIDGADPVKFSEIYSRQNVVLFFYPGDFTPVCTREAGCFRDYSDDFKERNAVILGVSRDDAESHRRFAAEYNLPYELLSDPEDEIAKLFAIQRLSGFLSSRRVTFVIDTRGTVRAAIHKELNFQAHVKGSLAVLDKIVKPD